ncbi:MAG: hypothetical protein PHW69_07415 [Elusimicrobiaceae bacterium]|nr:hypothetical protein [Elusimicrobiaceae bacterium]
MKLLRFPVLSIAALCCGCMSFHTAPVVTRGQMRTAQECAGQNRKFREITVEWKQRIFKTASQNTALTPEEKKLPPVPVSPKDRQWLLETVEKKFAAAGLYDRETGTDELHIVAISYNRWDYSSLSTGFLIDTGWMFILPASIPTVHYMHFAMKHDGKISEFTKSAKVKTCFHLLLLPLYPFMPPGRSESSALKAITDSAALTILTETPDRKECFSKRFRPPQTEITEVEPKPAALPEPEESAPDSETGTTSETEPAPAQSDTQQPSADADGEYGVQVMPE